MISAIIISTLLLFIAILLLGVRIFFVKNGTFPNIHIGSNKALRNKGIACATTQDRQAQNSKRYDNKKMMNEIIENY